MYEKGLPLQPYIIVIGPKLSAISESYVAIDTSLYSVASTLEALDVCFKAFNVLHARYPPESSHIWMVLQKALCECITEWDTPVSYVENVISRYITYIKQSRNSNEST